MAVERLVNQFRVSAITQLNRLRQHLENGAPQPMFPFLPEAVDMTNHIFTDKKSLFNPVQRETEINPKLYDFLLDPLAHQIGIQIADDQSGISFLYGTAWFGTLMQNQALFTHNKVNLIDESLVRSAYDELRGKDMKQYVASQSSETKTLLDSWCVEPKSPPVAPVNPSFYTGAGLMMHLQSAQYTMRTGKELFSK